VLEDPRQAPHQIRHVRAEEPGVDVRLIDDDEGEVREEPGPARVLGKDRRVEDVGIREDRAGPVSEPASLLRGRVAVVGPAHEIEPLNLGGERLERSDLVAREGFRREEEEGSGIRIRVAPGEDRELVGEALPARGPRGQCARADDLAAVAGPGPEVVEDALDVHGFLFLLLTAGPPPVQPALSNAPMSILPSSGRFSSLRGWT